MPIQTGPCEPWPIDPCCTLPDGDEGEALVLRWQRVATRLLWMLSGRRWGPSCPVAVRPCRRSCLDSAPSLTVSWGAAGPWIPYMGTDGLWRNASVCGCSTDCSCGELCEVELVGPIHDIVSVDLGGEVLVPGVDYRVDSPNRLVRLGEECWPDCQDMSAAPGEADTFTVTYRTGLPLDVDAIAAVSALTCHLIKGCSPGGCGCKATKNVTRVTRQGYEVEMADPTLIYSEGRTGIPEADLWISAVNPYRQASPSRVYSPDYKRPRSTLWP